MNESEFDYPSGHQNILYRKYTSGSMEMRNLYGFCAFATLLLSPVASETDRQTCNNTRTKSVFCSSGLAGWRLGYVKNSKHFYSNILHSREIVDDDEGVFFTIMLKMC